MREIVTHLRQINKIGPWRDWSVDRVERWNEMRMGFVYEKELELFLRAIGDSVIGLTLNVACGIGRFMELFGENVCVNLDFSPSMLRVTRDRFPGSVLVYADAFCLPFRDGAFGTVFSSRLIHHQRHLQGLLAEFCRTLRTKGEIIVDQTHRSSLPQLVGRLLGSHMHGMDPRAMEAVATQVSLRVVWMEKAFCLPTLAYGFIPSKLRAPLDRVLERVLPSRSFWRLQRRT